MSLLCTPPLFEELQTTTDWKKFESGVNMLLRLIGINIIYHFPNQKGQADGFFRIKPYLSIMYDATLDENFINSKQQQIENYITQMLKGTIDFDNYTETFYNDIKQVWIITRYKTRLLRTFNNIVVKEISVTDLINIYQTRLNKTELYIDMIDEIKNL